MFGERRRLRVERFSSSLLVMKRRTPPDEELESPESAVRGPDYAQLGVLCAALLCPLCRLPLRCPTTLACGHSLCSRHVADPPGLPSGQPAVPSLLPLCPLPDCSATPRRSSAPSTLSASSRVRYRPAPPTDRAVLSVHPKTVPEPPPDVSLNKVISLLRHTKLVLDAGSESDADNGRPRKRRRHQSPDVDGDSDLLAHLQHQATRHRTIRRDEPLLSPSGPTRDSILSHFQKELLAELTCEICFVLLYQPITTPCQHVRLIPLL